MQLFHQISTKTLLGGGGEGKGTVEGLSTEYVYLEPKSKLRMVYKIVSIGFLLGKYAKQTLALLRGGKEKQSHNFCGRLQTKYFYCKDVLKVGTDWLIEECTFLSRLC